jgi:predicted Rossmann fold flavoprotein
VIRPYKNELNKISSFFVKKIIVSQQLVVIGGGAAGFFCAINAARFNPQLKVILLEKTSKLLSKVKISGGGRCNVTHACFDISEMSKKYPRGGNFVKKAFHYFFTTDTIDWFKERDVILKEEQDGRMFPASNSSQTIVDCLFDEANKYGVAILLNAEVKKINAQQSAFNIQLSDNKEIQADFVCIASGGYPKSSMFHWLTELGHTIESPVPSLFTFNLAGGQEGIPGHPITTFMGVSVGNARVKIAGSKLVQQGALLITHWGFSGPAILKLSAWGARELANMNYDFKILVNWLPDFNEQQLIQKFHLLRFGIATQKLVNKNPFGLPNRLWEYLLMNSGIKQEIRWADLPSKDGNRLIKYLCNDEYAIKGKTTFKEEFVTAGGIKLTEIDHNTMMSKKISNIFFAGEIMDVDGLTGGFNFQHAWTSGFIAGKAIANLSNA